MRPASALVRFSLVLALLLSACTDDGGELAPDEPVTPTEPEEVELSTADGKLLTGTWQAAPGVERGVGLLLLHQVDTTQGEGHDRHDWDGVFELLVDSGLSVLAIDFRSHGGSDPADVPIVDLGSDREQLQYDVRAGIDWLDDQHAAVGPDRIGAVGLGLGGTMAVVANHESGDMPGEWGLDSTIAISARRDRAEDLNPDGDTSLSLTDSFYIAALDNELDSSSAVALHEITSGERRILLQPSSALHGAELLQSDPALGDAIADWFIELWPEEIP